MQTNGNNMAVMADRIVSAILDEPYFKKDELVPRVCSILKAWIRLEDQRRFVDKAKTFDQKKVALKLVERENEMMFYRDKLKTLLSEDQMKELYLQRDLELLKNKFQ